MSVNYAAVRGFHYYRSHWHPYLSENLTCAPDIGNAFDAFAIKTSVKDDRGISTVAGHLPRELSRTTYFLLIKGADMIAEITDDHYRKSPLVQGGLEIPCKVIVRLPRAFSNDKLIGKYMQLVNEVYAEPLEPFIVGRVTENENDDNFNFLVTEKKVKRFEKLPTAKLKNKDEKQKAFLLLQERVALVVRTITIQHKAKKLSKLKANKSKFSLDFKRFLLSSDLI